MMVLKDANSNVSTFTEGKDDMEALGCLAPALTELCQAYEAGRFVPLLESDVVGYLYYILVKQNNGDASQIHVSARIYTKGEHRKFPDVVIGPVRSVQEQVNPWERWVRSGGVNVPIPGDEGLRLVRSKSFAGIFQPRVGEIEVAVEIKSFLNDFRYTHLRDNARNSKTDLAALADSVNAKSRLLLLFDEKGFFGRAPKEHSLEELVRFKNEKDPSIRIVYISVDQDRKCSWRFLE